MAITSFSEHFGIDPRLLEEEGAFEPLVTHDTPLFIDPRLLARSSKRHMRRAARRLDDHFASVGAVLARSTRDGDAAWDEALTMLCFPEPPATCLGVTEDGTDGRGIDRVIARNLLSAAAACVATYRAAAPPDGASLSGLPFLLVGFGPDRVSDMTTNIIFEDLAAYTEEVLEHVDLPRIEVHVGGRRVRLPEYRGEPILLVPRDVLSEMHVTHDLAGLASVVERNDRLRADLNERLPELLQRGAASATETIIAQAARGGAAALAAFRVLLDAAAEPYDLADDPGGVVLWRQVLGAAAGRPVVIEADEMTPHEWARSVVDVFDEHVREGGAVAKCLTQGAAGDYAARRVRQLRRVFYGVAESYCRTTATLRVTFDAPRGLSTIWQGDEPLLDVDVVSSEQTNLASRYRDGAHERRAVVLLDFGEHEANVRGLLAEANERRGSGEPAAEIVVVEV